MVHYGAGDNNTVFVSYEEGLITIGIIRLLLLTSVYVLDTVDPR